MKTPHSDDTTQGAEQARIALAALARSRDAITGSHPIDDVITMTEDAVVAARTAAGNAADYASALSSVSLIPEMSSPAGVAHAALARENAAIAEEAAAEAEAIVVKIVKDLSA